MKGAEDIFWWGESTLLGKDFWLKYEFVDLDLKFYAQIIPPINLSIW